MKNIVDTSEISSITVGWKATSGAVFIARWKGEWENRLWWDL